MTQFAGFSGMSEAQLRQWTAYQFAQDSTGLATDGVLTGLGVTQTATASASVLVAKGAGIVQTTVLAGAIPLVLDTDLTLDVLTANPVGGLARNDLVVFDSATITGGGGGVRVIVGTPNASPTDPTLPSSAIPLARLRHAASATTVPTAKIDNLRVGIAAWGSADESNRIRGVPFAGASVTKAAKRLHWGAYSGTTDGSGLLTVTHGAGFTPTAIQLTAQTTGRTLAVAGTPGATTFQIRAYTSAGGFDGGASIVGFYLCGE